MCVNNIIISDEKKFYELKKKFILDGFVDLLVISDFDRTLTKSFVNGKMISSLLSILRNQNMLIEGYSEKAQTLFEKYHSIEIDDSLSIFDKIPFINYQKGTLCLNLSTSLQKKIINV